MNPGQSKKPEAGKLQEAKGLEINKEAGVCSRIPQGTSGQASPTAFSGSCGRWEQGSRSGVPALALGYPPASHSCLLGSKSQGGQGIQSSELLITEMHGG